MSSQRFVCEKYETPYEEGYRAITTLEEHDKQIRAEVIEEYKTALIKAFSETNINEYGFYPQNIVDMVAIKLKERINDRST